MKISELLRGIADLIDQDAAPKMNVEVTGQPVEPGHPESEDDLARMKLLAGLRGTGDTEYSNSPEEMYGDIENVTHDGTDINKSKHPADIRTNAPSMYPGAQWRGE